MTLVKLLPSDGHRPRKSDTPADSTNIKLIPAGTSSSRTTPKERRKQQSPRNDRESRNLSLPLESNMRSGRSFYDNAGESRSTAGGRSKRSSGSKQPSSRKRDRPRSLSPRGNVVEDAHSVSLRPAVGAGIGGASGNSNNRGSKRQQGVHLHSHHSRRKTSEGSRRASWYGGAADDDEQRGYSESSEEYVRVMGRASNGAGSAYPKSILLSIRNGDDLLAEVEANLSKMDFTVVTTALAQAVRLGCNGEDPRISRLKERCCELLRRRQQPRRADEIISSLHCILELSSTPAHCGEILSASTTAVSSRLRECTGDDLSNLCRCICKAEYLCPTLLTCITEECMARASELEPADISTIAWGLAKMGFGSDVLFQRLARVIEVTTHLFSGAYLSNLMWAFASVGYRSETMLAAVAQRCEELMGAVLESADEDVDRMALHPMEMSTLVWALSRLHAPSAEPFYLMVCEYTTANIELFKASELCTLVTGISRVSWKGQGDRTSPSNDLNVNPGQLPQPCRLMFQKCAEYVSAAPSSSDDAPTKTSVVSFSDKQVRIFVTALAKVGLSHTRLFDCAQQRSDRRMARTEPQTAATPQRVSLVRSVDEDKPTKALPVARYPVEGRSTSRGRMRASMPIDEDEDDY